ncbi:hypothetical protein HY488_01630 [Candidatus Woesearchaeota archaeon]|nr:hypothetical protein [Candidatus Woesearchaeota archaeon]
MTKKRNNHGRTLVFDSGPVISLATNSLLWTLEALHHQFNGDFYIPAAVKRELVDVPLEIKKFKFEALQVLYLLNKGILKLVDDRSIKQDTFELLNAANHIFKARGNWLQIVHMAEMQTLASAIYLNAEAVVVDERTTRILIEAPMQLHETLGRKLHTTIYTHEENLAKFQRMTRDLRVIRSTELLLVAYELGLLDKYLPNIPHPRKQLLESVLWGVKLNGCAVTQDEIDSIVREEIQGKE